MERQISPSIYYVGVDNPDQPKFENQYPLYHGMSYNSYVIRDRLTAVLDSVEAGQGEEWIRNVEEVAGSVQPDFLVVHHMEPDHSANIAAAIDRWPDIRVVCSAKAAQMLGQFFPERDFSDRVRIVKEGDTLELGAHTLQFYAAPMVHWPEVMVSYETSEHILFSADAFGKFGALQYEDDWTEEARRYYINIVGKYGNQVQSLLKKLDAPHILAIAPLHGPVLRAPLSRYLKLYDLWSTYRPETRGVLVAYASIYGGTEQAALRLAEMLRGEDCGEVVVADLSDCDQSEAIAQAFRLSSMVVAAPTYDAGLYPAMHDFLYHLTIKNYRNRRVGIIENGSWAPVAGRQMKAMLEPLPGVEIVEPIVTVRSRPNEATNEALAALARRFAKPEKE